MLLYASTSWACIFLAGITISGGSAQPGGTITVNGFSFGSNPVDLHLDSLTGSVLATAMPDDKGNFTQAVTIPSGTSNGTHIIVATEAAASPDGLNDGSSQGVPSRATFEVGAVATAKAVSRPSVSVASSVGVGTLIIFGVAVACVGVFIGGLVSLAVSRSRRPQAEPVS